jgi:hypothetical protein
MPAPPPLLDVTGTVSIADTASTRAEVEQVLVGTFGASRLDLALLRTGFELVDRLFAGAHPGYLACDMPYHDLRHSLDTALVAARIVAGCVRDGSGAAGSISADQALLGVLLAVLHDVGYLRETTEAALVGPQLAPEHEARGVRFAARWLGTTALAGSAPLAELIQATHLRADWERIFAQRDAAAIAVGCVLGAADLVSQIADRWYVERCYHHLYPEFVLGGIDRRRLPDGREELLYRDALDLVVKTEAFCEAVIRDRLRSRFAGVAHGLAAYFGGADPYADAIGRNLDRLARIAADGGAGLIGGEPPTTTRDLASVYRGRRPRADR